MTCSTTRRHTKRLQKELEEVEAKLTITKENLSSLSKRNVNKRIKRRESSIDKLKEKIEELTEEVHAKTTKTIELEDELQSTQK